MDRETLDSRDKETLICLILSQAEAIERLTKGCGANLRNQHNELLGTMSWLMQRELPNSET
jgi:hypothetical protein